MELINESSLKRLDSISAPFCASMYIPLEPGQHTDHANKVRIKNALKIFDKHLFSDSYSKAQISSVHKQFKKLVTSIRVNSYPTAALFATDKEAWIFGVPEEIESNIYFGQSLYTEPVHQLMKQDSEYYMLALSQNQVKLYAISNFGINEVDLPALPSDLQNALNLDELKKQIQHNGARVTSFHGHGGYKDHKKEILTEYFRRIDVALRGFLNPKNSPLIIVGVDYLLPIYTKVSGYKNIISDSKLGNPDRLTLEELKQHANNLVKGSKGQFSPV